VDEGSLSSSVPHGPGTEVRCEGARLDANWNFFYFRVEGLGSMRIDISSSLGFRI
jgi:hypothetical protein